MELSNGEIPQSTRFKTGPVLIVVTLLLVLTTCGARQEPSGAYGYRLKLNIMVNRYYNVTSSRQMAEDCLQNQVPAFCRCWRNLQQPVLRLAFYYKRDTYIQS